MLLFVCATSIVQPQRTVIVKCENCALFELKERTKHVYIPNAYANDNPAR